jgi:hypothetical protein
MELLQLLQLFPDPIYTTCGSSALHQPAVTYPYWPRDTTLGAFTARACAVHTQIITKLRLCINCSTRAPGVRPATSLLPSGPLPPSRTGL